MIFHKILVFFGFDYSTFQVLGLTVLSMLFSAFVAFYCYAQCARNFCVLHQGVIAFYGTTGPDFQCFLLLLHELIVEMRKLTSNVRFSGDTTVKVWSMQAGRELCSLRGHTGSVNAVLLLSSEQTEVLCGRMGCTSTYRLAVSGSSDACLNIWLALEGALLRCLVAC